MIVAPGAMVTVTPAAMTTLEASCCPAAHVVFALMVVLGAVPPLLLDPPLLAAPELEPPLEPPEDPLLDAVPPLLVPPLPPPLPPPVDPPPVFSWTPDPGTLLSPTSSRCRGGRGRGPRGPRRPSVT